MKVAAAGGGGHTLSFIVRRQPTLSFQYRKGQQPVQLRQKSSSSSSSSSSPSEQAAESSPKTTPSSGRSFTSTSSRSAPASAASSTSSSSAAGASIPSVPERSLRQILKSSAIGRLADRYGRAQDRRPYLTQFLSTLVIYLCGDLAAQLLVSEDGQTSSSSEHDENRKDGGERGLITGLNYDPLRTLRHLTVGAVASIPVYKWFMFLHNNFNYSSRALSIAAKVIISQCCFAPTFNTYFFSTQSLLAGASVQDTWERLKVALPTSLINSVKLWPAITAFMFAYVDPRFRSVFAGAVAVGWQTYLSWLNQKAAREVRELEEEEEDGEVEPASAARRVLQSTT